jgi:hypothetical protein
MAKVTRTRLARGTKLTPDHIHVPLQSIATEINSANIESEQLQHTWPVTFLFLKIGQYHT